MLPDLNEESVFRDVKIAQRLCPIETMYREMVDDFLASLDAGDLDTALPMLVGIHELVEEEDDYRFDLCTVDQFIDGMDWMLINGRSEPQSRSICFALMLRFTNTRKRSGIVDRILGCRFWNCLDAFSGERFRNHMISMVINVLEWLDKPVMNAIVDRLMVKCLREIQEEESDIWFDFIYACVYFDRELEEVKAFQITNVLVLALQRDEFDQKRLEYCYASFVCIINAGNWRSFMLNEVFCRESRRILEVNNTTVSVQIMRCYSALCQHSDETVGQRAFVFDFPFICDYLLANHDNDALIVAGMDFLTNACTLPDVASLLIRIPSTTELIRKTIQYGSHDAKIHTCCFYTNVVYGNDREMRVEMMINDVMGAIIDVIALCGDVKRKLVVHVVQALARAQTASLTSPALHSRFVAFIAAHSDSIGEIGEYSKSSNVTAIVERLLDIVE